VCLKQGKTGGAKRVFAGSALFIKTGVKYGAITHDAKVEMAFGWGIVRFNESFEGFIFVL